MVPAHFLLLEGVSVMIETRSILFLYRFLVTQWWVHVASTDTFSRRFIPLLIVFHTLLEAACVF